jgi:hypothetical protein
MTYVETSVILAQLLAEDRCPPESLWADPVVTSRLTEYEVWHRIHARGLGNSHGESVRLLLGRFRWLEMTPLVLARAGSLAHSPANARCLASGFGRVSSGSRAVDEAGQL